MAKITKEAALLYHSQGKPGKIEVVPTKPYSTQTDLSLAYSPGVAEPCLEIEKNPQDAYKYTAKGNLVAVISNGTAVLGLGDIGALSGKPVMEGKGLLFKIYAGIDVFDIEVDEKDPEKFIAAVKAIAPTFGGINLEDIKAPECFEIERRLKEELDIPVMHDDQHGTAIISSAGLVNALQVAGKKIEDVKIVVNGAGASAVSCTKLYVSLGARLENIVMLDSKGVISKTRTDLNEQKRYFATDRTDIHTLEEAIKGADVFLGLSKGNVLSQDMVRSMAPMPIVFALANPTPEISYEDAMAARPDVLMATGRSDYPNQINNVIGFPYIFRGALDTQAKAINEEMKIAAVHAIANLAKQPVPDVVNAAYHVNNLSFGAEYFIPKPVDPRLITEVSCAVAKAAMESGVARTEIKDWDAYCVHLRELMGYESKLTRQLYDTARRSPQRVVFAEGIHPNMLKAAYFTALGTQSSAATIPVTLEQTKKNGVSAEVAGFVIPLCATIHLSGSTLKIVACALALMMMQGIPFDFPLFAGFIFMLGITMIAAPGVPGGAIMASLGILQSMLGFDESAQALMIALYIAMDSFGTACNVTGDGAIALIIDKIMGKNRAE